MSSNIGISHRQQSEIEDKENNPVNFTHRSKITSQLSNLDLVSLDLNSKGDSEQIDRMLNYLTVKYNKALTSLARETEAHMQTKSQLQSILEEKLQFKYERDKL